MTLSLCAVGIFFPRGTSEQESFSLVSISEQNLLILSVSSWIFRSFQQKKTQRSIFLAASSATEIPDLLHVSRCVLQHFPAEIRHDLSSKSRVHVSVSAFFHGRAAHWGSRNVLLSGILLTSVRIGHGLSTKNVQFTAVHSAQLAEAVLLFFRQN